MKLARSVTTLSLVFILYFCTSGGAFTTETLVQSAGPGLALLTLILVPLVYSLPEVLIVGELASMLPEEGGYYARTVAGRGLGRRPLRHLGSDGPVRSAFHLEPAASHCSPLFRSECLPWWWG